MQQPVKVGTDSGDITYVVSDSENKHYYANFRKTILPKGNYNKKATKVYFIRM